MREESKEKLIKNVERYSSDEDVFTLYTELSKSELEKNTMIAEAREEGINKRNTQIAKSMIQKKFNLDSISEITGLSIKELSKLKLG